MTIRHHARSDRDQSGFTLVELVIALSISILIIGPISGAVIIGLRSTDSSSLRLSQTRDIEYVQGILPRDVLSATTVQANVSASATATCANTASLLKLTWQTATLVPANQPPTTTLQNYEVDYYYRATVPATFPPTGSLLRTVCTTGGNTTKVLATSLSSSAAQQSAVASGGTVTLTLTDSSCARFSASAQQRATTTTDVTTTTTATTFPACTG